MKLIVLSRSSRKNLKKKSKRLMLTHSETIKKLKVVMKEDDDMKAKMQEKIMELRNNLNNLRNGISENLDDEELNELCKCRFVNL
jgi:hypothetical protein